MSQAETTALADLVEARTSEIHGQGVFARVAIGANDPIGVYEGDPTDIDGTYVLWVEGDEGDTWHGIDGRGVLRFLNHGSVPNVEFDGPELYAVRDISPGEELLFDYGEEWVHVP